MKVWILAARPKTLPAAVAPVIVGTAMAYASGLPHWPSAVCALLGAALIQIGTNLANDYFDFVKGTDTDDRKGPTRATQAGFVAPGVMLRAAVFVFALVLVPGAYILWRGGWPFLIIGILSIACGVLYTGGPYPLGYVGLGDVFVLVFFGPVAVVGTYYLQTYVITPDSLIAGLAVGLMSVALLAVNNMRDVDEDRRAGKRTLAVRFGRGFARVEYAVCLFLAAFVVPAYFFLTTQHRLFGLVPIVVLGSGIPAIKAVFSTTDGATLNHVLGTTG
ncbi:MAG: 1,4-dihydroxy-2-naphthoate polyprenyltransferase, partial [bacterium]|nr:1,4-dihydroxy-2-naphthoate polyprenyltransferase [bacterium]